MLLYVTRGALDGGAFEKWTPLDVLTCNIV